MRAYGLFTLVIKWGLVICFLFFMRVFFSFFTSYAYKWKNMSWHTFRIMIGKCTCPAQLSNQRLLQDCKILSQIKQLNLCQFRLIKLWLLLYDREKLLFSKKVCGCFLSPTRVEICCWARGSSRDEVGAVPGAGLPKPDQAALPKWRIVMLGALLGKRKH